MKIVPSIDLLGGNVVRLIRGNIEDKIIYSNDPVMIAKKWKSKVQTYCILWILIGTRTGDTNIDLISKVINSLHIPVQIGGGIRSIDSIKQMLDMGVF